jgi:hypothetical protein
MWMKWNLGWRESGDRCTKVSEESIWELVAVEGSISHLFWMEARKFVLQYSLMISRLGDFWVSFDRTPILWFYCEDLDRSDWRGVVWPSDILASFIHQIASVSLLIGWWRDKERKVFHDCHANNFHSICGNSHACCFVSANKSISKKDCTQCLRIQNICIMIFLARAHEHQATLHTNSQLKFKHHQSPLPYPRQHRIIDPRIDKKYKPNTEISHQYQSFRALKGSRTP